MTEGEAIAKLDDLLKLLQSEKEAIQFNDILTKVKDKGFDGKLLKIALYRLEEDKYAYELVNEDDKKEKMWSITIQGAIFHGYVEQKRIDGINQFNAENAERVAIRNDRWLVRGTWFAGIAAVLLLLWQIFLWYYPQYKDYPYCWIWQTIVKKP
jgi:hypothetical protein